MTIEEYKAQVLKYDGKGTVTMLISGRISQEQPEER